MKTIGIRELRQQASRHLREVEAGESFEITDRGRPVARLVPVPRHESTVERLRREGRLIPGNGKPISELGPPLPPTPGVPTLSELLAEDRASER